jgi:hypothetical protein
VFEEYTRQVLRVEEETEERNSEDMSATTGTVVVGIGTGDMVQHTGTVKLVSAPSHEQISWLEVFHTDGASVSMKWLCNRFGQMAVCARGYFFVVEWEENGGGNVECSLGCRTVNRRERSDGITVSRRRGDVHTIRTDHSLRCVRRGNDIDTGTSVILWNIEQKVA